MSETPVPLPPGRTPDDTPSWTWPEAARWARERPPGWARPGWSALALLLSVAWAVAAEPLVPCSDDAPCGPDWLGAVQIGLVVAQLLWYFRLPEATLVSAPLLAALVTWNELLTAPGTASRTANSAVVAALALGWTAAQQRLAARQRQRHLVELLCSGARHRLPKGAPGRLPRGTAGLRTGLVLCAVAAAAVGAGLNGTAADAERAAAATAVRGEVTGSGEESLRLRTTDGELTVASPYPEEHPVGSTVTVLVDGDWSRLAAEPYDAFGWQLLALAAALPGLTLVAASALARHRAGALENTEVPVLRVLLRTDLDGDTWVYSAGDAEGLTPLFSCTVDPCKPAGPGKDAEPDTRMHEALLHGAPHEGGELAVVVAGPDGEPLVARTDSRIRLADEDDVPVFVRGPGSEGEAGAGGGPGPSVDREAADRAAAAMPPGTHPVRWGPERHTRYLALLPLTGAGFLVANIVRRLASDGFGWHLAQVLLLPAALTAAALFLGWRVTADRSGLWLTGAWKVEHLPWKDLRAVTHIDGSLEAHRTDGSHWRLADIGIPWLDRRLRRDSSHARAAAEINAMRDHPHLRPTEESPPLDHGMPLGPLLLGACVLWGAALFFV
ncbi:hypothetical protein ACFW9F_04515 [Streptomyces sp. NPDC059506]|uniref:hypothetical protein n=1 Tax=Streptomyces sp. NPDC059506 TaxID=3347751 RepID=UPI0036C7EDBB